MDVFVGLVVKEGVTGLCAVAKPCVETVAVTMCCFEDLRENGERGLEATEPERLGYDVGEAMLGTVNIQMEN